MATKKASAKATAASALVFRKEWIFDPVPPWIKLNRGDLVKINQLKEDFTKRINEVLKGAQQQ